MACVYGVCVWRVNTACEYGMCVRCVNTACEYGVCIRHVNTTFDFFPNPLDSLKFFSNLPDERVV